MTTPDPIVHEAHWLALSPTVAYRLAALRSEVFVVEQDCPYLDLDGRDLEPDARQCWIETGPDTPVALLRVLGEPDGDGLGRPVLRIGRVVTAPDHRRRGLAAVLMAHVLRGEGPFVLDAQSHLADWYGRFGFIATGGEFLLDGIPHLPMRRP
ncbi:MAG: GNAT family N-acetyltransferase [Acidimicrobiales bacterium]